MSDRVELVFFAPGVHTGGGLTLLRAIAESWPDGAPCLAFIDRRAADSLSIPPSWAVVWCDRTLAGTVSAELRLAREAGPFTTVFCFNSVPPLFARAREVIVYVHNPYLVGMGPPLHGRLALRILAERLVFRLGLRRVARFWVQTGSMAKALRAKVKGAIGEIPAVDIVPFVDRIVSIPRADADPIYDFIYVSDGAPHKNHARLFAAWEELATEGLYPTLAVTLGPRDAILAETVERLSAGGGIRITNLGHVARERILDLYGQVGALIFPSIAETYGLPLVEAAALKVPVVASERDFVRDVCEPAETFDPESTVSIARAVKRHLALPDVPRPPSSAAEISRRISALSKQHSEARNV